jgi:hypothetical protein
MIPRESITEIATVRERLQFAPTFVASLGKGDIMDLTDAELARLEPWVSEMVQNRKKGDTDRITPRQALGVLAAIGVVVAAVYNLAPSKKETIPTTSVTTGQNK